MESRIVTRAIMCAALLSFMATITGCGSNSAPTSSPSPFPRMRRDRAASVFPDAHEKPPRDWRGNVFRLSQNYPASNAPAKVSSTEEQPWLEFDFQLQPQAYLETVLAYVYQGNIETDWRLEDNTVRTWYHAPWMHWGPRGREFIRGLTRERYSRPGELGPTHQTPFQAWAVGFYNPPGGYAIGQVWADPENPNPAASEFPHGTVAAKLLFTDATLEEVPYLKDSVQWQANILETLGSRRRAVSKVRLLQLDVAVRDPRADHLTGWVFGTFVYQSTASGQTAWDRMVPVGLMWGNDPGVTPDSVANGDQLQQMWKNPEIELAHYGWAGRLNGPVDNPLSSCLSCHATAQIPTRSAMTMKESMKVKSKLRWFRNVPTGEPFDKKATSTHYSLQLAFGIENFYSAQRYRSKASSD